MAGLLLAVTAALSAVDVLTDQRFDAATLPASAGWGSWSGGGGTIGIATDTLLTFAGSPGSVRGTYPTRGSGGGGYVGCSYGVSALATRELFIEFRAKMPSAVKQGVKFLKIFGQRPGGTPGNYANTTFGLDYTGVDVGGMYCVSFGDGSGEANDTAAIISFNGAASSHLGRSAGSAVISTPQGRIWSSSNWGTDWHHFRMRVKFNSGTSAANEVADGAYHVEIDGQVYVDARNLFNRHWSNGPIDRVELFGWTQTGTTPFELWYDNVKISTGGFDDGDLMPPAQPAAPTISDAASAHPTLSGTTEAEAAVRILDDGVLVASVTADGGGAWSWTPAAALGVGSHTFTVTASDAAGNTSPASPPAVMSVAGGGGGDGSAHTASGSGGGGCGAGLGGLGLVIAVLAGLRLRPSRAVLRQAGPLGLLLVCCLCGRGWAAEYHVMPAGSDAATGTSATPWRTIGHAAALAVAGDTVVIHAGTYVLGAQIAFANSGSAGHPITYRANSGDSVLIDGGAGYCLTLQFRSHLIFQDLRFTTASTAVGAGMVYMEGTNHCEFLGCTFSDMPAQTGSENTAAVRCMQTEHGQSVGCVFRDNLFTGCRSPALRLYDTDGWIIENNEFVDCLQAVGGKDQPNNMLVRRNRITGGQIAFYFAGQSGCTNVTITENIVVGTTVGFQVGGLGTYGNLRDDIKLYNNTFYECSHLITGWDDVYTRRQSYHSNIFHAITAKNIPGGADTAGRFVNINKYGSVAVDPANYTMDWNCLSIPAGDTSQRFIDANIRAQTIAAWNAAHPPFEAHSIAADPQLVDAAGGDFRLQGTSPCRGSGRGGNDMGAYPRGSDGTVIGRRVDVPPPVDTDGGGGGGQRSSSGSGDGGGCGAGGVAGMGLVLALLAGLRRSRR